MPYKTFTLRERPDREDDFEQLSDASWPRFLRQQDALGYGQYWPRLFTTWADWQLLIVDEMGPTIAATHAVPLVWNGTVEDRRPTTPTFCARPQPNPTPAPARTCPARPPPRGAPAFRAR